MKLFNIESPLMRFFTKVGDLILLNFLWILCCLPVITIGASTTAMYSCLLNRSIESSTVKRFFKSFASNLGQATILLLVEVVAFLLVYVNIRYYMNYLTESPIVMQVVLMIPSILILTVSSYIFPLQAHFANTIKQTLKNAALISIANFPISVLITAINLLPIIIILVDVGVFLKGLVFLVIMGTTTIAYVNSLLLLRVFRKYVTDEDEVIK